MCLLGITKGAAAPTEQNKQKGGPKMNDLFQKQILSHMLNLMKESLEKMIKEEREIYLKQHNDTKANGYYTRDLYTPIGVREDLRVARTRDGKFNTSLLPYRRDTP